METGGGNAPKERSKAFGVARVQLLILAAALHPALILGLPQSTICSQIDRARRPRIGGGGNHVVSILVLSILHSPECERSLLNS